MSPAVPLATRLPEGKQRLIDAALRLAAREGVGLSSLGLRELAREAGLNHNTFYRHFEAMDDLAAAAASAVVSQLMAGLGEIRRNAARHADATEGAADYFLDFVRQNPDILIVGLRELHSADSPMRAAMKEAIQDIAEESADQMLALHLVPGLDRPALIEASSAITYYMWYRALDIVERPRQRKAIRDEIIAFVRAQFLGRVALRRPP